MNFENLAIPLVILEFTLTITFFFSVFNPLKKKEALLINRDKLSQVKIFFLSKAIKDVKTFLWSLFFSSIISLIILLFGFGKDNPIYTFLIVFVLIFYILILSFLFIGYISTYRNREAICDASSIKNLLKVFKVKRRYLNSIEKMLDISLRVETRKNYLGNWFLDNLDIKDKRIRD